MGITPDRRWQDEDTARRVAELHVACEQGIVTATTGEAADGLLGLSPGESDDDVSAAAVAIRETVEALGGPVFVDVLPDG